MKNIYFQVYDKAQQTIWADMAYFKSAEAAEMMREKLAREYNNPDLIVIQVHSDEEIKFHRKPS